MPRWATFLCFLLATVAGVLLAVKVFPKADSTELAMGVFVWGFGGIGALLGHPLTTTRTPSSPPVLFSGSPDEDHDGQ